MFFPSKVIQFGVLFLPFFRPSLVYTCFRLPLLPLCTLKLLNLLVDIKVCKSLAVIWQRLKVNLTAGDRVY